MYFLTSMSLLSMLKVLDPIDSDICLTKYHSTYQQKHEFQLNTFLLHFCHVFFKWPKNSSPPVLYITPIFFRLVWTIFATALIISTPVLSPRSSLIVFNPLISIQQRWWICLHKEEDDIQKIALNQIYIVLISWYV